MSIVSMLFAAVLITAAAIAIVYIANTMGNLDA
jgi:hypothetical protein